MEGVRPSKKFLDAIKAYPRPDTLSEARSFFGIINQVSHSFAMSSIMEPFRHLLKPDTWAAGFSWTEELEEGFKLAKERIIEAVTNGVKHFEVGRQTCLAMNWSKQGNGFYLMQKWCQFEKIHPSCCPEGWRLVLAGGGSLSLQSCGTVQWRVRHFVLGCDKLMVAVDHKPLLGILNDKSLADIKNPKLLMLKEKTLWFNFDVIHDMVQTTSPGQQEQRPQRRRQEWAASWPWLGSCQTATQ